MLKNYLKIALRNLRRSLGYTFINLSGLAVGIACCLMIVLFVMDELSYDRFHERADQIHRVILEGRFAGNEIEAPVTPAPMARTLVADFPEVETATRIFPFTGSTKFEYEDRQFIEEDLYFVDSTFFDVFSFPLVKGNPKTALVEPHTIVVTESMAQKYFGDEDPIDKMLTLADTSYYRVTGVVEDPPANSHFQFDFLGPMASFYDQSEDLWISNNYFTYLILDKEADPAALEAKLPEFFKRYAGPQIYEAMGLQYDEFEASGNQLDYYLQPLLDIHLHSNMQFELAPNGSITYVYVFSAIAFFILLIACINFMNLATARSAGRAKEVGMRKVMGSTRIQLIRQFLSESMLLSFLALLLAIGLIALLLPVFNSLSGKAMSMAVLGNGWMLLTLLGVVVVVGLLAGSYPAFFLSSFRPVTVLKGTLQAGARSAWLRNGLVVFQFAISIALIAGTVIVYNQLGYVRSKELGFDKEHVVVIQRAQELGEQTKTFRDELRANPNVVSVTSASTLPGGLFGQTAFQPEGAAAGETVIMSPVFADHDFVETLGLKMAAGRDFDEAFATDSAAFVINQTAAEALGWAEPLGKQLTQVGATPQTSFRGKVIGVVEDFHYASLHQEIGSLVLRLADGSLPNLAVRVQPDDLPGTLAFLERQWQAFAPDQPFQYAFLDEDFDAQYRAEQRLGKIFTAFAAFAILIACLGLFGLASFITEQRRKEIGVRKVLGASVPGIILLLSKDFTKLVLVAFVVAAPVAYVAMQQWLQDFAYRTGIAWWIFLVAGLAALVIAWVTVSYQSIRAALANPVKSLRYE